MGSDAPDFFQFIRKFYFEGDSSSMLENPSLKFFSDYTSQKGEVLQDQSIEGQFLEFLDFLTFLRSLHVTTLSFEQSQGMEKRFLYNAAVAAVQVPISCDIARILLKEVDGFWQCPKRQQQEDWESFIHKLKRILWNIEQDCTRLYTAMQKLGYHNLLKEAVEFKGYE